MMCRLFVLQVKTEPRVIRVTRETRVTPAPRDPRVPPVVSGSKVPACSSADSTACRLAPLLLRMCCWLAGTLRKHGMCIHAFSIGFALPERHWMLRRTQIMPSTDRGSDLCRCFCARPAPAALMHCYCVPAPTASCSAPRKGELQMVGCNGLSSAIQGADVCVRAACRQGEWMTGFSCQVTRGHATGFYVSDASGSDKPTGPLAQVRSAWEVHSTGWLAACLGLSLLGHAAHALGSKLGLRDVMLRTHDSACRPAMHWHATVL